MVSHKVRAYKALNARIVNYLTTTKDNKAKKIGGFIMFDFEKQENDYRLKKADILSNNNLSEQGKRAAIKELTVSQLAIFEQEQARLEEEERELTGCINKTKQTPPETDPETEPITEQDLLIERREIDLMISRLLAIDKRNFLMTVEQEAAQRPEVFKVAYSRVLEVAEKHFPQPAARPAAKEYNYFDGSIADINQPIYGAEDNRRAYTFSQLQGIFARAVEQTASPGELNKQNFLEVLGELSQNNILAQMRLNRGMERLKQELSPKWEEIGKHHN